MKKFLKQLLTYFLHGLLVFVPIGVTAYIIVWSFTALDGIFRQFSEKVPPGLGVLTIIAVITTIGVLTSSYLGNKVFGLVEKLFTKLPLVKLLYNATRDFVGAFAGEKKKFDKPAMITFSKESGAKVLGFITRESLEQFGLTDHVAVYLPQSYNFAGQVLIFPKDAVTPLNINSSQAMTFIVSGGVAGDTKPVPAQTPKHTRQE
jgi:uncharacterized membrane protein